MWFCDRPEKTGTVRVISNDAKCYIFAAVVTAIGGNSSGWSGAIKHIILCHILENVYLFKD